MGALIFACAFIVSGMGLVFLSSWHLGLAFITQLPPSTWPIPHTATLCLLLSGIALFNLHSSARFSLSKALGLVIFLLGFHRTIQLLFPMNLLLNNVHLHPTNSSQMVISAAIGFTLVGVMFFIFSKRQNSIYVVTSMFFSVPLIFLGSTGIFLSILPHSDTPFVLHFYTAIGLFLIGLGFLIAKFMPHLK